MNKYAEVFIGAIPLIIFILSQFILPIEVRSNKKKQQLSVFFEEVLLPLSRILRHKEAKDINSDVLYEISQIYEEYFYIIPQPMNLRYEDILMQFNKEGCLKRGTYSRYKRHIELMFSYTREKLGIGKKSYLVEFDMLSRVIQFVIFVLTIITIFLAEICIISLSNFDGALLFIAFYTILCISLIGLNIFIRYAFRHLKRMNWKWITKMKRKLKEFKHSRFQKKAQINEGSNGHNEK